MTDTATANTPAGWYDDGSGRQRWWDGGQWTQHFAEPARASEEQKALALNAEVARYANSGWAVQSAMAGQVVMSKTTRMGWFWNLILVLLTAGLWLIYVIYRALNRKSVSIILTVDDYGYVRTRKP